MGERSRAAEPRLLRVGHSPDPDDAFMYFGLASGAVEVPGCRVEHVLEDIATLNRRAARGELEVTAVSARALVECAERYYVMTCGASVGRGYGPLVVARQPRPLAGARVAVPGRSTTAALLAELYLEPCTFVERPFDAIFAAIERGEVDAGVVIHEGQLTFAARGLVRLADLGKRWTEQTGLPLPLGVDLVRRDLGRELAAHFARALVESIRYAEEHEEEALAYALRFGRGVDRATGDRFVRMYVNRDTVDLGPEGKRALEELFRRAHERGLVARMPRLDFIAPA